MTDMLLAATIVFFYVGLRAFQQLNVVHRNYKLVIPTSIFMSVGDVAMILIVVKADTLWLGVSNGIAGGLGCIAAMYISHKVWGKKDG